MKTQSISSLSHTLGIEERFVEPYGRTRAKINLDILEEASTTEGRYILVTAMTPTPFGEGKTTTSIGLSMALNAQGKRASAAIRQSSLGPTFGTKGGGAGGGAAHVWPLEDSVLHVTGDIHAIGQAHNQLAALVDSAWFHGQIDVGEHGEGIVIRRVVDVNDRALRSITIGQGGEKDGRTRVSGFDITPASELMAIHALVDGGPTGNTAKVLQNLRERIGKMVLAFDTNGQPITAEDIGGAGAAAVLMRETVKPTLMQTVEGTPVFIHGGPFANIAHGCSSIVADRVGLHLCDYVVTEAGFGADIGAEKFLDIKCRQSGLWPDAAVLVATVRACKFHTGNFKSKELKPGVNVENVQAVRDGAVNLVRHIKNLKKFGLPTVVAINRFPDDTADELEAVAEVARAAGADAVELSEAFAKGSAGALKLADAVVGVMGETTRGSYLYALKDTLEDKLNAVARSYGANGALVGEQARKDIERIREAGFADLPICIAKTHLSFTHQAKRKGAPTGFDLPVEAVRLSAGAGFLYVVVQATPTMPGLSKIPAALDIDIDENGEITGLF